MKKISSLIEKALSCTVKDWHYILLADWKTIMGHLSQRMYLLKVENETVFIAVYDIHWMQELKMMTTDILKSIHTHTAAMHLTIIRFFLHRLKQHHTPTIVKHKAVASSQPCFLLKHSQALNLVHDQSIRDALLKLFYSTRV